MVNRASDFRAVTSKEAGPICSSLHDEVQERLRAIPDDCAPEERRQIADDVVQDFNDGQKPFVGQTRFEAVAETIPNPDCDCGLCGLRFNIRRRVFH